jgi:hypothetical protein
VYQHAAAARDQFVQQQQGRPAAGPATPPNFAPPAVTVPQPPALPTLPWVQAAPSLLDMFRQDAAAAG